MTAVLTAIFSGLPIIGKLLDRFFPDKSDERAELRAAVYKTKAFKGFLWVTLGLVVLEVLLKTLGWLFPQMGWPESIIGDLEFYKLAALIFTGIGG